MGKTIELTKEFGLKEGYLKNKEVWLKPIPDKNMTLITQDKRNSIHAFMYEGATIEWCVPVNERLDLYDPFASKDKKGSNEDERAYFEGMLGLNLKITSSPDCYWRTDKAKVKITKDASVMQMGVRFDMSNPEDVIRIKILGMQRDIAPNWEEKDNRPHYKWVLVDAEIVDNKKKKDTDSLVEAFTHFGSIKESLEKMKDFLTIYYMTNKEFKEVPANATSTFLQNELRDIIDNNRDKYLEIVDDPDKDMKLLILKGIGVGAIQKIGVNAYAFPGDSKKYTLEQLINHLNLAKENSDDIYMQVVAQIDMVSKPKKK